MLPPCVRYDGATDKTAARRLASAPMRAKNHIHANERLALPAREVAQLLGISERHVWALEARGQLPKPRRFGRSVRWVRSELIAWLDKRGDARAR